jgi:hypothetical protein
MRILSIIAVIAATATPALAHWDIMDREKKAKPINSAQVEKAAPFSLGTLKVTPNAGRTGMRRGDR